MASPLYTSKMASHSEILNAVTALGDISPEAAAAFALGFAQGAASDAGVSICPPPGDFFLSVFLLSFLKHFPFIFISTCLQPGTPSMSAVDDESVAKRAKLEKFTVS